MEGDELPKSQLGTLEYWDSTYSDELDNFTDHGEEGENWFGENATKKIIQWISKNINREDPILDIGCGNGTVLIRLHKLGYTHLTGIDYSVNAIELAKAVAESNGASSIGFETCDILSPDTMPLESSLFKIIIDKGTYDAICVNPDADINIVRDKYISFIRNHLQPCGYFLLTSCNWTLEELIKHFSGPELVFIVQLETQTLTFGGKSGSRTTSVIFQKK